MLCSLISNIHHLSFISVLILIQAISRWIKLGLIYTLATNCVLDIILTMLLVDISTSSWLWVSTLADSRRWHACSSILVGMIIIDRCLKLSWRRHHHWFLLYEARSAWCRWLSFISTLCLPTHIDSIIILMIIIYNIWWYISTPTPIPRMTRFPPFILPVARSLCNTHRRFVSLSHILIKLIMHWVLIIFPALLWTQSWFTYLNTTFWYRTRCWEASKTWLSLFLSDIILIFIETIRWNLCLLWLFTLLIVWVSVTSRSAIISHPRSWPRPIVYSPILITVLSGSAFPHTF